MATNPAPTSEDTLVGITTRTIHFARTEHGTREIVETRAVPAGTEVYVREARNGKLRLRVPGTLLFASVYADAVTAA